METKKNAAYYANLMLFFVWSVFMLINGVGGYVLKLDLIQILIIGILLVVVAVSNAVYEKVSKLKFLTENVVAAYALEAVVVLILLTTSELIRISFMNQNKVVIYQEIAVMVCILFAYGAAKFFSAFGMFSVFAMVFWPTLMSRYQFSLESVLLIVEIYAAVFVAALIFYLSRNVANSQKIGIIIFVLLVAAIVGFNMLTSKTDFSTDFHQIFLNFENSFSFSGYEKYYYLSCLSLAIIGALRMWLDKGNLTSLVTYILNVIIIVITCYGVGSEYTYIMVPFLGMMSSAIFGTKDSKKAAEKAAEKAGFANVAVTEAKSSDIMLNSQDELPDIITEDNFEDYVQNGNLKYSAVTKTEYDNDLQDNDLESLESYGQAQPDGRKEAAESKNTSAKAANASDEKPDMVQSENGLVYAASGSSVFSQAPGEGIVEDVRVVEHRRSSLFDFSDDILDDLEEYGNDTEDKADDNGSAESGSTENGSVTGADSAKETESGKSDASDVHNDADDKEQDISDIDIDIDKIINNANIEEKNTDIEDESDDDIFAFMGTDDDLDDDIFTEIKDNSLKAGIDDDVIDLLSGEPKEDEAEKARLEAEAKAKAEAEEKARLEAEAEAKAEAEERARLEAEARAKAEAEEKARLEAEARAKAEAEEKARLEAEARAKAEAEEKARLEAEARAKAEAEEKARLEAEARAKAEAEEKARLEAEARAKAEAEEKARLEAEAKAKAEAEEKARLEAEAKAKAEAEEKARLEAEQELLDVEEDINNIEEINVDEYGELDDLLLDDLEFIDEDSEAEARSKAEAEEKARLEAEARAKAEAEEKARLEAEARAKAEAEEKARLEAEAKAKAEAEEKARLEAEAKAKAEAEEKARLEAEARAKAEAEEKARLEAEARAKAEAEEKARLEAEAKAKAEAEEKARLEAEARAKAEAEEKARLEAEARAKAEAEEKARLEAEARAKAEAEEKARLEAEARAKAEAEEKARLEAEARAKAEAEEKARLEAEARAKAEAEEKARLEAEARAKAEAEEKARLEAEARAKAEAEEKARLEAEARAKAEAEEKARLEAEAKAKAEAEEKARLEAEARAKAEAEEKARLEAEAKAKKKARIYDEFEDEDEFPSFDTGFGMDDMLMDTNIESKPEQKADVKETGASDASETAASTADVKEENSYTFTAVDNSAESEPAEQKSSSYSFEAAPQMSEIELVFGSNKNEKPVIEPVIEEPEPQKEAATTVETVEPPKPAKKKHNYFDDDEDDGFNFPSFDGMFGMDGLDFTAQPKKEEKAKEEEVDIEQEFPSFHGGDVPVTTADSALGDPYFDWSKVDINAYLAKEENEEKEQDDQPVKTTSPENQEFKWTPEMIAALEKENQ